MLCFNIHAFSYFVLLLCCKWQLRQTGAYKPPKELVSDLYYAAHILDTNFKKLRGEGKVAAVKGEVRNSNKDMNRLVYLLFFQAVVFTCFSGFSLKLKNSPQVAQLVPGGANLKDGSTLPCDLVVCATGFAKSYDYMPASARETLQVQVRISKIMS